MTSISLSKRIISLLLLVLGQFFLFSTQLLATTGVPLSINYQGRLKSVTGAALDGTYDFIFTFYDASSGGILLATKTVDNLEVDDGYFTTTLDLATDVSIVANLLFLQIQVKADSASASSYDSMTTRVSVGAAPFAQFTRAVENLASDPVTNLFGGRVYYNTVSGVTRVYNAVTAAWQTVTMGAPTLDDAYNNFGAVASKVVVDAAQGQTGGLEFESTGTSNIVFDLQSTGDLVFQDAGVVFVTVRDDGNFIVDGTTTLNGTTVLTAGTAGITASSTTVSGTGLTMTSASATTGSGLANVANAITTGNGLSSSSTGLTTGSAFKLTAGFAADSAGTGEGLDLIFSTPVDTTGTNIHQGLNITPTIGNASGGTNTTNLINIAAVTGDAQVTLNALQVGALTGTAATENALVIGSGWDAALVVAGTTIVSGTGALTGTDLTLTADIAVNGGDLTTTATTFNLLNATATTLNIGGAATTLALAADNATITTGGALTINTPSTENFAIATGTSGTLSLTSGTTGAVTLDSGSTGGVNIGTNANAKIITIGNTTTDTSLVLTAGTAGITASSTTVSGTGLTMTSASATTGSGLANVANAITTGNGLSSSSTGLTTGSALKLTAGFAADSAGTGEGLDLIFSTPVDTTGTNIHQGLNITPTIGNASGGTNTTNLINIAAVTGDAQVSLNALQVGALTGTAATENALVIGSGWDSALTIGGNTIFTGAGNLNMSSSQDVSLTGNLDLDFVTGGSGGENLVIADSHASDVAKSTIAITANNSASASTALNYILEITNGNEGSSSGTYDALAILKHLDTDETVADGILIQATTDLRLTDAIDVSDAEINNAINIGPNNIVLSTAASFTDGTNTLFTVTDSGTTGDIAASGDAAVNGGDLTTTATTFNLLNATATTLNIGGAATTIALAAANATITGGGALTFRSAAGTALAVDSGTTGALNLGTTASAKAITLGNATGATSLALTVGTGGITGSSTAISTTGMTLNNNSVTTGTGLLVAATGLTAGNGVAMAVNVPNAASQIFIDFRKAGTTAGSIAVDVGNTLVNYNTTSDARLKENIVNTGTGIETLRKIQVRDFSFKTVPGKVIQGFIAQELKEVYPLAVSVGLDQVDSKGRIIRPWMVDYSKLTPLLVQSLQDIDGLIETLVDPAAPLFVNGQRTFVGKLFDRLNLWLANASNGITKIVTKSLNTDLVESNELCLTDEVGGKTCVTKAQLDAILNFGLTEAPVVDPDVFMVPIIPDLDNGPELDQSPDLDIDPELEPPTLIETIEVIDEGEEDLNFIVSEEIIEDTSLLLPI